jgi:hypothetical protein
VLLVGHGQAHLRESIGRTPQQQLGMRYAVAQEPGWLNSRPWAVWHAGGLRSMPGAGDLPRSGPLAQFSGRVAASGPAATRAPAAAPTSSPLTCCNPPRRPIIATTAATTMNNAIA